MEEFVVLVVVLKNSALPLKILSLFTFPLIHFQRNFELSPFLPKKETTVAGIEFKICSERAEEV
jgi:hypothetical protein